MNSSSLANWDGSLTKRTASQPPSVVHRPLADVSSTGPSQTAISTSGFQASSSAHTNGISLSLHSGYSQTQRHYGLQRASVSMPVSTAGVQAMGYGQATGVIPAGVALAPSHPYNSYMNASSEDPFEQYLASAGIIPPTTQASLQPASGDLAPFAPDYQNVEPTEHSNQAQHGSLDTIHQQFSDGIHLTGDLVEINAENSWFPFESVQVAGGDIEQITDDEIQVIDPIRVCNNAPEMRTAAPITDLTQHRSPSNTAGQQAQRSPSIASIEVIYVSSTSSSSPLPADSTSLFTPPRPLPPPLPSPSLTPAPNQQRSSSVLSSSSSIEIIPNPKEAVKQKPTKPSQPQASRKKPRPRPRRFILSHIAVPPLPHGICKSVYRHLQIPPPNVNSTQKRTTRSENCVTDTPRRRNEWPFNPGRAAAARAREKIRNTQVKFTSLEEALSSSIQHNARLGSINPTRRRENKLDGGRKAAKRNKVVSASASTNSAVAGPSRISLEELNLTSVSATPHSKKHARLKRAYENAQDGLYIPSKKPRLDEQISKKPPSISVTPQARPQPSLRIRDSVPPKKPRHPERADSFKIPQVPSHKSQEPSKPATSPPRPTPQPTNEHPRNVSKDNVARLARFDALTRTRYFASTEELRMFFKGVPIFGEDVLCQNVGVMKAQWEAEAEKSKGKGRVRVVDEGLPMWIDQWYTRRWGRSRAWFAREGAVMVEEEEEEDGGLSVGGFVREWVEVAVKNVGADRQNVQVNKGGQGGDSVMLPDMRRDRSQSISKKTPQPLFAPDSDDEDAVYTLKDGDIDSFLMHRRDDDFSHSDSGRLHETSTLDDRYSRSPLYYKRLQHGSSLPWAPNMSQAGGKPNGGVGLDGVRANNLDIYLSSFGDLDDISFPQVDASQSQQLHSSNLYSLMSPSAMDSLRASLSHPTHAHTHPDIPFSQAHSIGSSHHSSATSAIGTSTNSPTRSSAELVASTSYSGEFSELYSTTRHPSHVEEGGHCYGDGTVNPSLLFGAAEPEPESQSMRKVYDVDNDREEFVENVGVTVAATAGGGASSGVRRGRGRPALPRHEEEEASDAEDGRRKRKRTKSKRILADLVPVEELDLSPRSWEPSGSGDDFVEVDAEGSGSEYGPPPSTATTKKGKGRLMVERSVHTRGDLVVGGSELVDGACVVLGRPKSAQPQVFAEKKIRRGPRSDWPRSDTNSFCHQCRRTIPYLVMNCSGVSCHKKYCVRCIATRYEEEIPFDSTKTDWICLACCGVCSCDHCTWKRGGVYTSLRTGQQVAKPQYKAPSSVVAGKRATRKVKYSESRWRDRESGGRDGSDIEEEQDEDDVRTLVFLDALDKVPVVEPLPYWGVIYGIKSGRKIGTAYVGGEFVGQTPVEAGRAGQQGSQNQGETKHYVVARIAEVSDEMRVKMDEHVKKVKSREEKQNKKLDNAQAEQEKMETKKEGKTVLRRRLFIGEVQDHWISEKGVIVKEWDLPPKADPRSWNQKWYIGDKRVLYMKCAPTTPEEVDDGSKGGNFDNLDSALDFAFGSSPLTVVSDDLPDTPDDLEHNGNHGRDEMSISIPDTSEGGVEIVMGPTPRHSSSSSGPELTKNMASSAIAAEYSGLQGECRSSHVISAADDGVNLQSRLPDCDERRATEDPSGSVRVLGEAGTGLEEDRLRLENTVRKEIKGKVEALPPTQGQSTNVELSIEQVSSAIERALGALHPGVR